MSGITLVKTRIRNGVWEGVLRAESLEGDPDLRCIHQERQIDGIDVTRKTGAEGEWIVRVAIPPEAVNDGIQAFLIQHAGSGEVLGRFAVLAGDSVEADIRAELALLRAELDLLKRAFRRHCAEAD